MTSEEQHELMTKVIAVDKLIKKYVIDYTWVSGEDTTVYPIQGWLNTIDIQVSTNKNLFTKCIQRLIKKSDGKLVNGWFVKSDGSCPSYITLIMASRITDK